LGGRGQEALQEEKGFSQQGSKAAPRAHQEAFQAEVSSAKTLLGCNGVPPCARGKEKSRKVRRWMLRRPEIKIQRKKSRLRVTLKREGDIDRTEHRDPSANLPEACEKSLE